MSAESDAAAAAPDPDADPSDASAQFNFPQAKRRFRREAEEATLPAVESAAAEVPGSTPEDRLRAEIGNLNARLNTLLERPAATPPAPEADARGAKYFRLTRKASAPAGTPARAPGVAAPETAGPVVLASSPARGLASYQPHGSEGWLLISAAVLAFVALAFFLGWLTGRPNGRTTLVAPPSTPSWSEKDVAQLDRVLDTARSGNLRNARLEMLSLDKQLGGRASLEAGAAVFEARVGNLNNAEADLVRKGNVAASSRDNAAMQEHLGFVYARRRDFAAAANTFANAALADPFDPLAFYYWGASLRRSGRLPEAVDKFREVLLRIPAGQPESDSLWQCASLQMRLCQIEAGSDTDMKAALDQQLTRPVPSVYWLVTAVAYDLQHGDVPGAVSVLKRLQVISPPELLTPLLNDYFLRSLAVHHPEVASYFPDQSAERVRQLDASGACFIDP